jgi:hypothetical protein
LVSVGKALINDTIVLLGEETIAFSSHAECEVLGAIAARTEDSSTDAVTVKLALGNSAEEVLFLSGFSSVKSQVHFHEISLAAGKLNRADHSIALSDDNVGPFAAEPRTAVVRSQSVLLLGSVFKAVKLDSENTSSLGGWHNNSAHFVALFLDEAHSLGSFFDVISVIFTKEKAGGGVGAIS